MSEALTGEVSQLLEPEEALKEYLIPSEMSVFAKEGYHIAVIEVDEDPNILTKIIHHIVKQDYYWVADLAVLNPDFQEGDTVEIEAREINRTNFYVSPDPFADISQQAGDSHE